MQRVAVLVAVLGLPAGAAELPGCRWNGIPLWGKVKVVESFADVKVQVVTSFPDLKVKQVTAFPDRCGLWQVVESFPDFTVQFVESFPDVTVRFVESFPGVE